MLSRYRIPLPSIHVNLGKEIVGFLHQAKAGRCGNRNLGQRGPRSKHYWWIRSKLHVISDIPTSPQPEPHFPQKEKRAWMEGSRAGVVRLKPSTDVDFRRFHLGTVLIGIGMYLGIYLSTMGKAPKQHQPKKTQHRLAVTQHSKHFRCQRVKWKSSPRNPSFNLRA